MQFILFNEAEDLCHEEIGMVVMIGSVLGPICFCTKEKRLIN
jgi:hypothetical protein